jgi:hypothetical protein
MILKIYPLCGNPTDELNKAKFRNFFHGIFLSSRSASFARDPVASNILREGGTVAIESAKFLVPLSKDQREEFSLREREFAISSGWTSLFECKN